MAPAVTWTTASATATADRARPIPVAALLPRITPSGLMAVILVGGTGPSRGAGDNGDYQGRGRADGYALVLLAPEEVLVGVAAAVLVRGWVPALGHPATTVMRCRL